MAAEGTARQGTIGFRVPSPTAALNLARPARQPPVDPMQVVRSYYLELRYPKMEPAHASRPPFDEGVAMNLI